MDTMISGNFAVNGVPFAQWFNANMVNKVKLPSGVTAFPYQVKAANFAQIMQRLSSLIGKPSALVSEFVGNFCIIYNETGGQFDIRREGGAPDYFFEVRTLKNGLNKISYNRADMTNKLAGDQLKAWGIISTPQDVAAWNGVVWPGKPPVNAPANVLAAALDCDFYRYRGYGFNQLTFRGNYKFCVEPYLIKKSLDAYRTTAELDAEILGNYTIACGAFYRFYQYGNARKAAAAALATANFFAFGNVTGGTAYSNQIYVPRCTALNKALQAAAITPVA